jgi:hypothetical protein
MLGERACGASWHREQFCLNFFSPSLAAGRLVSCRALCVVDALEPCGCCAFNVERAGRAVRIANATTEALQNLRLIAGVFICFSTWEIGIDTRCRSAICSDFLWTQTGGSNSC